jgi:hypothetical protein
MTVPEKIADFLKKNQGKRFCDSCIASNLNLKRPQQSQQVTSSLAAIPGAGFSRGYGVCSICGKTTQQGILVGQKPN